MSEYFNDYEFKCRVDDCLEQTRKILHYEKRLTSLDNVAHKYNDKYLLADYLVVTAIACYINCLTALGLSPADLSVLASWSECLDVTLRLEVDQKCVFVKEAKREVDSPTRCQTEVAGFSLTTSKLVTTITEYFYLFTARSELVAYRGVGDSVKDRIVLQSRSSEQEIVTSSKTSPYPGASNKHFDVNISWLLRRIDPQSKRGTFSIDRDRDDCHTPIQNEQLSTALAFFHLSAMWCLEVSNYLMGTLFEVQETYHQGHVKQDLSSIDIDGIFIPVLPLVSEDVSSTAQPMIQSQSTSDNGKLQNVSDSSLQNAEMTDGEMNAITSCGSSMVLTDALVNQLLTEQMRSLLAKLDSLALLFPPSVSSTNTASSNSKTSKSPIISVSEAKMLVTLYHMGSVADSLQNSVWFLENMLQEQLVAAVGKTLYASDFTEYMRYHNRKLFKEEFQPRPFSHAVRRTAQHSPEGSIRIEEQGDNNMIEPIYTSCCSRSMSSAAPMRFALNASTNVTFGGDRHLHTWLAHSFTGQELPQLKLVAQARQFSCFIVLVGRIVSAQVFEPKFGMIVQNKDEITIPLDLEQIPTPKQFRDAIESLSPEQQRFAKAFRGMQLESTLFGVLVLQIKPQLETVLKLSTDILTKEIKLTQDLMEMFIKYQIPSDLLSVDDESQSQTHRLRAVMKHVEEMRTMISISKEEQIKDEQLKVAYLRDQARYIETRVQEKREQDCEIDGLRLACPAYELQERACMMVASTIRRSTLSRMTSGLQFDIFSKPAVKSGAPTPSKSDCSPIPPPPPAPVAAAAAAPVCLSQQALPITAVAPTDKGGSIATNVVAIEKEAKKSTTEPPRSENHTSEQQRDTDTKSSATVSANNLESNNAVSTPVAIVSHAVVDYTKFPSLLDRRYEELDSDSVLRPTIINPGNTWTKKSFRSLMSGAETKELHSDEQALEKNAAFDLLDALSKSGALVMHSASLHVVIAATHCFDKSLMDTVIKGNVNPIERVERSALIMASTIHELPASDLIAENQRSRVLTYSPQLGQQICE